MSREKWWLVHPDKNRASGWFDTARKALKHQLGDYKKGIPVKALGGYEAIKSTWKTPDTP